MPRHKVSQPILPRAHALNLSQVPQMRDTDNSFGKTVHELIADIVAHYTYPVAYNFPIGHEEHNLSLIFGRQASLYVQADKVLLTQ